MRPGLGEVLEETTSFGSTFAPLSAGASNVPAGAVEKRSKPILSLRVRRSSSRITDSADSARCDKDRSPFSARDTRCCN